MKLLNGAELSAYIKERQARQVRGLRQAHGIGPKLAIILTTDSPVSEAYINMKKRYGVDILVDVDLYHVKQSETPALINKLNKDDSVHGIIIQLPLADPSETDAIVNLVSPEKDVDGLGKDAKFDPATPLAIMWLLAGYNVQFPGRQILIVGQGRLVGAPLKELMEKSDLSPAVADKHTKDLKAEALKADIIVTATGKHGVITPDMLKEGAVVVDSGVADVGGKSVGDLAPEVYERDDLTLTPVKGGVGPLTVCALIDNVILAARRVAEKQPAKV
jgi:methylenetetrahydrofolate dehydrogenase (NADP+)/methenyltetrahydrofolate cyclohydrolase